MSSKWSEKEAAPMHRLAITITTAAKTAWWWLRQVLGDAAYENYLRSLARQHNAGKHATHPPAASCAREKLFSTPGLLSREEFYLDALRRRYSGVSRCC